MKSNYTIVYILIGFVAFALFWFVWRTPEGGAVNTPRTATLSQTGQDDFEPDAANVSPSTHTQLESLRKRVIAAPDDTTHLFRLARMLQDAHKPDEAARNYRHYLALHPENYQAWLDMTQSFGQAKLWEEAFSSVRDMLARYPNDPSALYNLGAIYANTSRMQEARDVWQRLVEDDIDPEITLLARHSLSRLPSL